jgi:hypothetical protein
MGDTKLSNGHLLLYEMNVKLNVLGSSVMHKILGHVDGGDVVVECYGRRRHLATQFAKKVAQP